MSKPDSTRARRHGRLTARSLSRWAACGLAAALPASLPSAPARAQLAPQMGAPVELGDLRRTFERAYGPVAVQPGQPAWTFTPGIDIDFTATDNSRALGIATGRQNRSEAVMTITPSLAIQGMSQRLTGSLYYAPQLRQYLQESRQSGIGQNLNASARATIFEDLLFLNASAYATEYSRAGGLGQRTGGTLSRQDRVQTTSVSIGPQLRHAFGDYGVAELGYTFTHLTQNGQALRTASPFAPAINPGATTTGTLQAGFTSGQEFGRINFGFNFQRIDYDGPGVLKGARRQSETLDLGYAATRTVTLLGQIGHQDIRYGGLRPVRINDVLWSVGLRWNPSPDTTMTARYGYRDGGDSFSFDGTTAPTARTRVTATFSEAMVSAADELQYTLGRTQAVGTAIVIDQATGMPVLVNNNFAGAQGGVSRVRRISVSGVLLQDVDTISLTFNRDERFTVSADVPGALPNTVYSSTTLSWQRELGPGLRGNTQITYGERSAARFGSQELITVSAGLNWALSETLSTRASYTYTHSGSRQPGFGYDASLVSVGLRKTF